MPVQGNTASGVINNVAPSQVAPVQSNLHAAPSAVSQNTVQPQPIASAPMQTIVQTPVQNTAQSVMQTSVQPVQTQLVQAQQPQAPSTQQTTLAAPSKEAQTTISGAVEGMTQVTENASDTPVVPETPANPYQDLNDRIASSALSLVGVTDGQWCTQVVQQALALAGVQDAYQLWPDQYVGQYGYYTDDPQAGNLVYYYNGGRGVDHIAVYIGNGMAVHGNYYDENGVSKTVVASVYINGGAPQFIQVQR